MKSVILFYLDHFCRFKKKLKVLNGRGVVFVVGFGIYFGIYFGIDMLIIVLLNFLDKHVFLVPTCSGDFILVTTKILHSCIFVKLHNC